MIGKFWRKQQSQELARLQGATQSVHDGRDDPMTRLKLGLLRKRIGRGRDSGQRQSSEPRR